VITHSRCAALLLVDSLPELAYATVDDLLEIHA
jgi:hypothetical protein